MCSSDLQSEKTVIETRKIGTRWFGKISTRYLGTRVSNNRSANFSQPSAYLNFNLNNIAGSNFSGNLLVRGRNRSGGSARYNSVRLYSAGITYQNDLKPLWAAVGRIYHPLLGGVGTVDGLGASYRWKSLEAGAKIGRAHV